MTTEINNWVCLAIYIVTLLFQIRFAYTDTYCGRKIFNKDVFAYALFVLPFFAYKCVYTVVNFSWEMLIFQFLNPVLVWIVIAYFLFGKMGKIGGGDVKVLLLMSMVMPWYDFYYWLLAANILALVIHYAIAFKTKIKSANVKSPFGVSMAICWAAYMLLFLNNNFIALW